MASGAPVVTFGEMLLRLSPPPYEEVFHSPQFFANFGGCEANVAVCLASLGVPCAYASVLPNNAIGDAALAALRAEGVHTDSVLRADGRLGIYFVELGTETRTTRVVYDRAHSAFANLSPASFDWPRVLHGAAWFHGSGITPALGTGPADALAAAISSARAAQVPVSIDLNYRAALWADRDPRHVIPPLVRDVDLLIGNTIAVRAMLALDISDRMASTPESARDVAVRLSQRCGARRVALTHRVIVSEREHHWSASLYDRDNDAFAHSQTHQVQVVDRVGGGDSFAATLIAGLLQSAPLDRALDFAVTVSAHKLTVPGDWVRRTNGHHLAAPWS